MKKEIRIAIFVIGILLVINFVSATYTRAGVQYIQPGGGFFGGPTSERVECEEGQDFILQIAPFGCNPAVVRSDLLEEMNVPVFCQLAATKINPLIDVEAISDVDFKGGYPEGVTGVDFHPARAALGGEKGLTSPIANNIGYVVIGLKKQKNASAVPEFVKGNLTAVLRYDIENALGIGKATFYIPVTSDDEWEEEKSQYSFWDGRYYIRAENAEVDEATISIYDGVNRLRTLNLEKGKSSESYLPGFYCLAKLKLSLQGLEVPETRAKLRINADVVEVAQREKFLDNKCEVEKLNKMGVVHYVEFFCKEDEGREDYFLKISPKVKLKVDNVEKEYEVGDKVYNGTEKNIYLGYIGKKPGNGEEILYVRFVEAPSSRVETEKEKDKLNDNMLSDVAGYNDGKIGSKGNIAERVVGFIGEISTETVKKTSRYLVEGSSISSVIKKGEEQNVFGVSILLIDVAGAVDVEIEDADTKKNYEKAKEDYEEIADSFAGERENGTFQKTFGERALFEYIELAYGLKQNLKLKELCEEFKQKYPESEFKDSVNEKCKDNFKLASSEIDNVDVLIDGRYKKISFEGISEPTPKDYGVDITVVGPNGKREFQGMMKEEIYYLDEFRDGTAKEEVVGYKFEESRTKADVESAVKKAFGKDSLCVQYVDKVVEVANDKKIDALLLMAIMKAESSCNGGAISSDKSSYGLMQINAGMHYEEFGFNNVEDFKNVLLSDANKNIEFGAQILRKNFDTYGSDKEEYKKTVESECKDLTYRQNYLSYSGWSAALRAYNGFGCAEGHDLNYVEKILGNFVQLGGKAETKTTTSQEKEYIKIKKLEEDYAEFEINIIDYKSNTIRINKGGVAVAGGYEIGLNEIHLKRYVKVSVSPGIDKARTEVNFPFQIGIEKRAIKLSPEKTKERIESLNKSIEKWESLNSNLGKVVQGMGTACLATELFLTAKNLYSDFSGKGIARKKVMDDKWHEKCTDLVKKREKGYDSLDECYAGEADNIDKDVDTVQTLMKQQNEDAKKIWGELETKNTDEYEKEYLSSIKNELKQNLKAKFKEETIEINGEQIGIDEFVDNYLIEENTNVDELKEMELYSQLGGSLEESSKKELMSIIGDVYEDGKEDVIRTSFESESIADINNPKADSYGAKESVKGIYWGATAKDGNKFGISAGTPMQLIVFNHERYYLELEETRNKEEFRIKEVYDSSGNKLDEDNPNVQDIKKTISVFEKHDASSYQNPFKSIAGEDSVEPVIKYYETGQYKGLPALVPFDLENGWYAAVKQTMPSLFGGSVISYGESGEVYSYYVCNVGENGIAEFFSGTKDDECQMFNRLTGQPFDNFPGLSSEEATRIAKCARDAIEKTSRIQDKSGEISFTTNCGKVRVKVGKPGVELPEVQCQDFMSPKDCQILFNVCDPVVCPSSRCDLGGNFPVNDVIQTGVIGGVVLCLPNAKEGIYMPVCLSGIHAGLDNWVKIQENYRDCLQDNLNTGEMNGICDELYSFYQCDLFWRQGLPFAKLLIPSLTETILGQKSRGGGEYLGVRNAWSNAEKSVDWFTQYYAANSYKAFKYRSTEEIGGEVCKNYASAVFPSGGNFLDRLTEPVSPSQFYGRFDEIPYTTTTSPPASQYKVFFYIYAGNDRGAYYKVYLRGMEDSSYYQDELYTRMVAQGYIPRGESVSETPDFLAPSGYKELCIMVNEQEECGFKQVTTEFAIDYIKDKYMEEQTSAKNIKTSQECVAGSASLYSLASPSLQGSVEEIASPAIYNRGIIRICATSNPGEGSDANAGMNNSRWVEVGECEDVNMKCWLDTESVEKVIQHKGIEGNVLEDVNENYQNILRNEGDYLSDENFKNSIVKINSEKPNEQIKLVNEIIDKVFFGYQKAHLLLLRGNAYASLAIEAFKPFVEDKTKAPTTEPTTTSGRDEGTPMTSGGEETLSGEEEKIEIVEESGESSQTIFSNFAQEAITFKFKDGAYVSDIIFPVRDIYFAYFDDKWWWSVDDKTWFSTEDTGSGSTFKKLSDKNKEFILTNLKSKSFDDGFRALLQRVIENNEMWVRLSDAQLSKDKVKFEPSRTFTIFVENIFGREIIIGQSRSPLREVYIKLNKQGKWMWSLHNSEDIRSWIINPEDIMSIQTSGQEFLEKNKDLLISLQGKSFFDGAKIIFGVDEI